MKFLCFMTLILAVMLVNAVYAQQSGDYYAAGNELFRDGEYEKALEQYTRAIQLDPRNANYYASRGAAYGKLDLYVEGLEELKKAVSVNPKAEEPYFLIESFFAELERIDDALLYFSERNKVTPNNAAIHVNLGYVYYRKGELETAAAEMRKAIKIDSVYPLAYTGLGVVYLSDNKDSEARAAFEKALAIRPDYPEAHLYLAIIYRRAGKESESKEEIEKAYALKPQLKTVDLTGTLPIRGRKSAIPILSLLPVDFQRGVDVGYRNIKLNLGIGITNIENENWYTLTTHPEIDYPYFGAKTSLEFLMNGQGKLRETDLEYAKILQYVRLGSAGKPFYLLGGKINDYTLGYGSIVHGYMNQSDESNRKIGALLAVKSPFAAFDGMLNDIQKPDVFAGRAGFKLFQNLDVGASIAMDVNQDGNNETEDDAATIYGGDVTLNFSFSHTIHAGLVADIARIDGYGMGALSGLLLLIQGRGITSPKLSLFAAYIYSGSGYESGFFNAFYEKEKRLYSTSNMTKTELLNSKYAEPTGGIYSKISIDLPPVFTVGGTYQSVFDVDSSGTVYLVSAFLPNTDLIARVAFYRTAIASIEESFTFDENTVTHAMFGYWFTRYTAFMLNYQWTYVWDEGEQKYITQERISPVLHVATQF